MKVLIVDDSKAMQVIVRRGLEQCGYTDLEFKQASDGKEALDIIREWEPYLVLTDWHMPEMTGIELLQVLKREMLPINVGLVTTETNEARIRLAMEMGAKFVVNKPFDVDTLHQAVLPFIEGAGNPDEEDENQVEYELDRISLPSSSALSKILNIFTQSDILVEHISAQTYSEDWIPCFLGLFSDSQKDKICAVAILDLRSTCILGGSFNSMPASDVLQAIESKIVPKDILDNCEKMLRVLSATLHDKTNNDDLHLRSVNFVPKPFAKLEQLFKRPDSERADFEIAVMGYGQGNITIVSS